LAGVRARTPARSSMRPRMAYTCCHVYVSSGCRAWLTSHSGPTACESAFRPAGTLEAVYSNNRPAAIENIIDADPVAALVREIMADRAQWTGSASDLLQIGTNRSGWPKSPRALAGRLRRAQPFLRTLGIEIAFGRAGRLGTRTIGITAMGENRSHNIVSTVSTVSDNGHGAALNHPRPDRRFNRRRC